MSSWLNSAFGEGAASAAMWIMLAVIVLVVLLVALRLVKTMRSGTFIAGGRNRAPRLAVVDAAAVDSQRRLVLVRRDNVEHLIMIGGPSDVVIEAGIRTEERERALSSRQMKGEHAAPSPQVAPAAQPPVPAVRPAQRPKTPATAPAAARTAAPATGAATTSRRHTVAVTPPEAVDQPEPEVAVRAPSKTQAPTADPVAPENGQRSGEVVALDIVPGRTPAPQPEKPLQTSLEEEMGRLLEDIAVEENRRP
jgi:hypothetical protein